MSRTAGQALVEVLADRGVRRFYTVPGESFLEVLDTVQQRSDLQLISCRHESGAAFMAEADGKLTGVPAVAMATRAVGAANLMIGVHTAWTDSTPLIVLLGQVDSGVTGRGAFQELDLPRLYAQFTVHAETLNRPERAAEVAARAHWRATAGRPGPAVVAAPADVLAGTCPPDAPELRVSRTARVQPDPDAVRGIADLVAGARHPVMLLGSGAGSARTEVMALAERFHLGVYTAFRRQDTFPNSHPHYLGHLTLGTAPEILGALQRADVVLALGTRLGEVTTQGYALPSLQARVVHVDLDARALAAPLRVQWSVPCDVAGFAAALLALGDIRPGADRDWSAAHALYLGSSIVSDPPYTTPASGRGRVRPGQVLSAMARRLPAESVLANDAGNFSIFCHRYWRFDHPHSQLGPVSGAMGYGVPAAVGAALTSPGRPVVALTGDGGFLMTGQELETAARYGAAILVIVFQNSQYGTIAMHQARRFGRPAGVEIGDVDLAGYARSLGADAVTVTDPADLDDAIGTLPTEQSRVVVVRTDPDVLTPDVTLSGLLAGAALPPM